MQHRILVAEDDHVILKTVCEELTDCGFAVSEATDGESAVSSALSEKPHLLLLDIQMPKLDGIGVMQRLRSDPWGKTLPIVVFTQFNPSDDMVKAVDQYEPAFYLIKSQWKVEDLGEKIKDVLGGVK